MAELAWPDMDGVSKYSSLVFASYRKILDPDCPPQERNDHQKIIEDFKSSSPYCVHCGLYLAQQEDLLGVHLGLQLVEHFVRHRWGSLSNTEQFQLKDKLMYCKNKIGSCEGLLPVYIKEGIARSIVEFLKQTWPHDWSSFTLDVFNVEDKITQVELVLLIFRRLAEDLLSYDSALTNQRKSTMLSSLKADSTLTPLFQLLLTALQSNSVGLCEVAITTLSAYVDWVDLQYLSFNSCSLLFILFALLCTVSELRLILCDCITGIISRKGTLKTSREHRELFLLVLSKDVLDSIYQCVSNACQSSATDETEYMFLKKLCQMMAQLGLCQLLPLWETSGFTPPQCLGLYMDIMLLLLSHPSQVVCSTCLDFWNAVVHHQFFKTHPVFVSLTPQLIKTLRQKLYKVGDPTQSLHISSHYSVIDFDGQEEFNVFFSKSKSVVSRILSDMVPLNSQLFIQESADIVKLLVTNGQDSTTTEVSGGKMSPVFLEWDASISFLECWVIGLNQSQSLIQEASQTGVAILKALLLYNPVNSTCVFCNLKALEGGLQIFISFDEEQLLQSYLEKILTYIVYPGTETNKFQLSKEQKQSRLNSMYCLINLVKSYAQQLLPATGQLLEHYNKLVMNDLLLYSEKCMFIEAFTILSHFQSPNDQDLLIGQLLDEVKTLANSFKSSISSLSSFIFCLSLDKDVVDVMAESSQFNVQRSQLCYCAHTVMGVLQRSSPRVKRECKVKESEMFGSSVSSFRHIVPLLMEFILPLVKVLHQLWSEASCPLLSNSFQCLHSLHQHDRDAILGIHCSSTDDQNQLSKIQQQLILAYDQCIMAIGFAWATYGPESLSEVGFIEALVNTVFAHLSETSQLRIKPIIRNLIIPMVVSCPPSHWQLSLAPVLARFCYITYNCLQTNWSNILQQRAQCDNTECEQDQGRLSDEVLTHQFTVNLTRQYIQLIDTVCLNKEPNLLTEEMTEINKEQAKKVEVLSDIAFTLFKYEEIQKIILLSVFTPFTWLDGTSVRKCINIAAAIFDKVSPLQYSETVIHQIMEQMLLGLRTHGEDGGICISLIMLMLSIYEVTFSTYTSLSKLLSSLPESSEDKVKSFNQLLSSSTAATGSTSVSTSTSSQSKRAKKKRDELRKILSGIIGKPLGELHKLTPVFLDLPSLVVKKEQRLKKTKAQSTEEGLTWLFDDNQS